MKAAVIGAGMAGVTSARQLSEQGMTVTIFDKSKGTGGRLSSRSWQGGWIDHGAPYVAVQSDTFAAYLKTHLNTQDMQPWQAQINGLPAQHELPGYIGVPRNSSITRAMLGDINFQPSTRIARLERKGSRWLLFNDGESLLGHWDLVVVTAPAPQTYALVREIPELATQVQKAEMGPCWVAAIQLCSPLNIDAEVMINPFAGLRRIVDNSAKPLRNNKGVYMLQATAGWSLEHLEQSPENVGTKMSALFARCFSLTTPPEVLFAHRWRYAFTKKALGKEFLWSQSLNIGVCGDWCLGRTVEDAWTSAMALSSQIQADL